MYQLKEIKKGKYRHFKGQHYELIDIATHTETGEDMAIYTAMYGYRLLYTKPLDIFFSKVDKQKYPNAEQEFKFEYIGNC